METKIYFLKIYQAYFLPICLLFFACDSNSGKKESKSEMQHLIVRTDILSRRESIINKTTNADTSYLEYVFNQYDLIDVKSIDSTIKVDLKYADTCNFLKLNIYDGLQKAYLPCEVALRLGNAQFYLKQIYSTYSLIIFDAARPLHVQQMMWDSLDLPTNIKFAYLSSPYAISLHNYGCAIDLSIIDVTTNKLLDMGTAFDFFGKLSQPIYELQFLQSGELSHQAFENRKLLRKVMQKAKFFPITSEWWHFNYCNKEFAAAKFKLIK